MNLAHPKSRLPEFKALVSRARSADDQTAPFYERWWKHVSRRWDAFENQAFAPVAFTATLPLLPLADEKRLELLEKVAELNEPNSPLMTTPGLCRLRLSLRSAAQETPYGALVLECTHQRDREDLLYEWFGAHEGVLDAVLQHCRDYPGSDLPDACVRQLMRAARDRKVKSNDRCVPIPLDAQPPLHDFEDEVEDERTWLERSALAMRTSAGKRTREARRKDPHAIAKRGVHPKHHGLLRAKFTVDANLNAKYKYGVFQPGAKYDAWIRLSNMSPVEQPDAKRDARGLAIKLEGVPQGHEVPEWQVGPSSGQDFLLASHPVFIFKDVRDYTLIQQLNAANRRVRKIAFLGRRLFPEVWTLTRALRGRIDHPLNLEYHSMIPYALGPRAVKYLVRPVAQLETPPLGKTPSPDYLRERLQQTLDGKHAVKLEFCLVVPKTTPRSIEDARVNWTRRDSSIVPVATIEIPPQDFSEPERMKCAESVEFSPWHTLRVHRPLGSLSRARLAVYRESAKQRRQANERLETTERPDAPAYPRESEAAAAQ